MAKDDLNPNVYISYLHPTVPSDEHLHLFPLTSILMLLLQPSVQPSPSVWLHPNCKRRDCRIISQVSSPHIWQSVLSSTPAVSSSSVFSQTDCISMGDFSSPHWSSISPCLQWDNDKDHHWFMTMSHTLCILSAGEAGTWNLMWCDVTAAWGWRSLLQKQDSA